jgi:deoxyribodipyrimidine photo-lyase
MTSDTPRPALVWLRDDLRIADNPALAAAVASRREIVVLFVLDDASPGLRPLGGAARAGDVPAPAANAHP